MRILAILGLAASLMSPQTLRAGETRCDFQSDIVALSDYVLKNRAGLSKFKGLRYGAISAYLKLRYGKVTDRDAGDMLMSLVQARVSRADELTFAWAIHLYGIDTAIAMLGEKSSNLLLWQGASPSVLRAAIVKEGVSALAAQWHSASPEQKFRAQIKIPTALLDKFDTYKSDLARQAEANGLLPIAAGLAATQDDIKAWDDFAARTKDKVELKQELSLWYWTPALVGTPALKREGLDPQWQKTRDHLEKTVLSAAKMPERDFLLTYVNQSGKDDEGARVADTILTVAADKSDGPWTMDRAWLTTYLELLTVSADPKAVDKQLASINFGGLRHYDGSIRDALDWMISADALKAYILRQSDVKSRPDLVSSRFGDDWAAWQTSADLIRVGGDLGLLQVSPKSQAITAELLFATGQQHQLASFITSARPDDMSVNLAEDFANRMDRICYGYLNFPAEGITFPDTPLFRFD